MCTTILVGKNASYDGSTIAARIEDSSATMFKAKKFIVVNPEDQPINYKSVRTDCEIKLPDNPLRYTCLPNVKKWRGVWGCCGVNEKNVSVSATETSTTNERVLGADPLIEFKEGEIKKGGIGEEDIVAIVLPYINTAKEGVIRLGNLLEEYGTYESNGVIFQDVDEIWYLESIGGHHWLARKVPDDTYVVNPNQFGIDRFDFEDALGEQKEYMCSADLKEFAEKHHLDLSLTDEFDPRSAFGSDTANDHIYNTPRAWVMHRYFNKNNFEFDGEYADYRPDSNDLPWAMVPEKKITIADVKTIMSNHYEETPYDPYIKHGDKSQAGKFRPIGINRDDVLAIVQIRPYVPEEIRAVKWLAFGCNVFNAIVPYYSNVKDTPAYLRDTTLTPTTENFYWINRLIASMSDSHFSETGAARDAYQLEVHSKGCEILNKYDEEFLKNKPENVEGFLEKANEEMTEYLKTRTTEYLDEVLFTSSMLMKNAFSRSDA